MRIGWTVLAAILVTATSSGCPHGTPPTPQGIDASVAPLPGPTNAGGPTSASVDASSSADAGASGTASASADAPLTTASSAATADPPDAGDPGVLPQTRDRPAPSSPALERRARALWDGIAHDDPDRAMPFFFPVTAYEQVKDVGSPAADWKRRLVAAYKRDIHALAKRLGDNAESAKFVRLEVPDERARWVKPDEEYNKIGYWRVYGTRIVYQIGDKERTFDITSLISWRGEWYVVHLTGFK